ncbi:MAG TPA: hypothetical protein VGS01_01430 [Candidatus Limnocylindria bacterium]|jgi:hypothetical protein|nr:hypothetical protein [Candidatus Limnocylindria bacterium]
MELFIALGGIFALDLLAYLFGLDSRDNHDRAIDAAHRGDVKAFRVHMNALERDIARVRWAG